MQILPIQEVYQQKFDRQKRIKELTYHAAGHCAHIKKISPGCYGCFATDPYRRNVVAGWKCNLKCIYCASQGVNGPEVNEALLKHQKYTWSLDSQKPDYKPTGISFSGGGEPLLYIDIIAEYMTFFHDLHKNLKKKPWYYHYTNGLLATEDTLKRIRDLGFDEIRFHLGASDFSEQVYKNMKTAVNYIKVISVETPAWPYHRKGLFEMLPRIEDIGVKHVNITEVQLNKNNFKSIAKALPNGKICQHGELQLYDDGLVYDIMEEVIRNNYSYSVLDCNCFVKSMQKAPGKWVFHEEINGLCHNYDN